MPERLASLQAVESACWSELARAVHDSDHPWRSPVLATYDGERADARTVLLREIDRERRALLVYTDARAPKVNQLREYPRGTIVMWSHGLSWQMRLTVNLMVDTDGLAVTSRWARLKLTPAAQDYLSPLAPGTPLAEHGRPPPSRAPLGSFAVISATVTAIDWLELSAEGHRRAVFDAAGARWVQP
jgi:pyridoxamine 5'-phosphate oxidase